MELLGSFLITMGGLVAGLPAIERMRVRRRVSQRLVAFGGNAPVTSGQHASHMLRAFLVRVGALVLGGESARQKLATQLAGSGFTGPDLPQIFAAARLLMCIVAGVIGLLVSPFGAPLRDGAAVAILAFLAPGLLLSQLASRRVRSTRAELPVVIDVLAIAMASGAAAEQAIRFVVQLPVSPVPVTLPALRGFIADLDRGTPYEASLERLSERLGIEEATLITEVLRQGMVHGTELVAPLKAIAREMREQRLLRARAAIGKATTQMTAVMVVCLLPALLGLLGAPAVVSVMSAIQGSS